MLRRRMIQHLREHNWTAVGIDFVIVVLGVFVGIQVANWNEDRQQSARQANYRERLRVDFVGIRERMRTHREFYREALAGGDLILSLVRAEPAALKTIEVDTGRMERALNALLSSRIPPPLPATYVEMRSEGQLSHIADSELRDRMAEYDRLLGVVQKVGDNTDHNLVTQSPILLRHFTSRTLEDPKALSGIREELVAYDLDGMRRDGEFAIAVKLLHRYAYNSLQQRERQLELIEAILTRLESTAGGKG